MPRFAVLLAFTLLAAGCGGEPGTVTGTVALDGQPVPKGAITFVKEDGDLVREGAVITDGAFQAKMPPGKYRVELTAAKVVGKRTQKGFDGKDEELEQTVELFPERFNTKSELTEQIKPGPNTLKLDLKSTK